MIAEALLVKGLISLGKLVSSSLVELKNEDTSSISEFINNFEEIKSKNSNLYKDSILSLSESFQNGKLTLVLGAGVSMDSGLPSWTNLLHKLIIKTLDSNNEKNKQRNSIAARLFDSVFGPNPLIAARYLQNYFDSRQEEEGENNLFINAIRDSIYEEYDEKYNSEILNEIVRLCITKGNLKKVSSVITYNYDDLLESKIEKLKIDFEYKSIFKTGDNPRFDDLPIYHVHGFLPQKGKLTKDNKVTLSDSSYHSQYDDTYGWCNMTQINHFIDKNCLFVGVSFSDPNQRRLLEIAKKQRGNDNIQHYLLKKKYKANDINDLITKILMVDEKLLEEQGLTDLGVEELSKFLVDMVHNFESNDARSFGVEIIWTEEFEDYAKVLKEIRTRNRN